MRLRWLVLAAVLAATPTCARPGADSNYNLIITIGGGGGTTFTPTFQDAGPGGSGYVTDVVFYPDANSTAISRTDTNWNYIKTSSTNWTPLFTSSSLPAGDLSGVAALVYNTAEGSAPSNSGGYAAAACAYSTQSASSLTGSVSILYGIWNGNIEKSTNGGVAWTDVDAGYDSTINGNNGTQKNQAPYIFCDPQSSGNVAYVARPSAAPVVTCNGGASWAAVSGITAPTSGRGTLIAGDPTSTVTSNVQQTVYISSYGTGVYRTTNGGTCSSGSFSRISGSPTALVAMWVDKFGVLWGNSSSTVYNYNGSSWTTHAYTSSGAGGSSYLGIAINPGGASEGAEQIVAINDAGFIDITNNGGSTWSGLSYLQQQPGGSFQLTATDIPWLAVAGGVASYIDSSKIAFDNSGNLYVGEGVGISELSTISSTTRSNYVDVTAGIEQLVVTRIVSPWGVYPAISGWDRGVYGAVNPDVFPSSQYTQSVAISGGWDQDYASQTPSFMAVVNNSNIGSGEFSGTSSDGGLTWAAFAAFPNGTSQTGGMIALDTTTDIIDVPGQGQVPYCSTNGGTSWGAISFPGSPANHWLSNYYISRHTLAADRVTSGVLYAYDSGGVGLFSSSGGCAGTWTKVFSGYIDGNGGGCDGFSAWLQAAPNSAGELFFTSGLCGGSEPTINQFEHSTNAGATWGAVTNVKEVYGFGYGAPKPGAATPFSLYFWGYYNSTPGLYSTTDDFGTAPTLVSTFSGTYPTATYPSGDNNVPGRIYNAIANSGGGVNYIDLAWACPAVGFSSIKPTSNVTGTITLQATHSGLVPVKDVQFFVDGALIGSQTTGSGTPAVYSQSWVTGGVATGSHVLSVATEDNVAPTNNCTVSSFNGTISGTSGTVNSGTAPTVGQQLAFVGMTGAPPIVVAVAGSSFTTSTSQSATAVAMVGANAMFTIPITTH